MGDGLSFFDFGDLPDTWRMVLRYVMRHNPASYEQVQAALAEQDLIAPELDEVLETLCDEGYLTPEFYDDAVLFRLLIARKSVDRAVNKQIWDALDLDSTPENDEEALRRGGRRRVNRAIWDRLDIADEPTPTGHSPKYPVTNRLWDVMIDSSDDEDSTSEMPSTPVETPSPRRRSRPSVWDDIDDETART